MTPEGLIEIARFYNAAEAQMARGLLQSYDIHCVTFDENHHQMQPYLQMAMPVRLMVHQSNAEQARTLLNEISNASQEKNQSEAQKNPFSFSYAVKSLLLFLLGGIPLGYSGKKENQNNE